MYFAVGNGLLHNILKTTFFASLNMFYYENWKKRAWKINVKKIGMKGFEKEVKRKEDHRGWNDAVLPKTYFRINQDLDNPNRRCN